MASIIAGVVANRGGRCGGRPAQESSRAHGAVRHAPDTWARHDQGVTPSSAAARAGFEPCAPFGSYVEDPLSIFMTQPLQGAGR